jgi:hypothetical protein
MNAKIYNFQTVEYINYNISSLFLRVGFSLRAERVTKNYITANKETQLYCVPYYTTIS